MLRLPRYVMSGQPLHVIQRGSKRYSIYITSEQKSNS